MQYRIQAAHSCADIGAVEQAIIQLDPAALVDIDRPGLALRVSTVLDDVELLAVVNRAGFAAGPQHVERVPSECCGGCGG